MLSCILSGHLERTIVMKNSLADIYNDIVIEDSREDAIKELHDFVYSSDIEVLLSGILDICAACHGMTLEEYATVLVNIKQIRERVYGY